MKEFSASVFHWNTDKLTNHRVTAETEAEAIAKIKALPEFGKDAEVFYIHGNTILEGYDPWGNGGIAPFEVGFFNPNEKRL